MREKRKSRDTGSQSEVEKTNRERHGEREAAMSSKSEENHSRTSAGQRQTGKRTHTKYTHIHTSDEQGGQGGGTISPGLYAGIALEPGV